MTAAFQPALAKHGVFRRAEVLHSSQTDRESRNGGTLIYTTLTVAIRFAPDGSNFRAVVVGGDGLSRQIQQ